MVLDTQYIGGLYCILSSISSFYGGQCSIQSLAIQNMHMHMCLGALSHLYTFVVRSIKSKHEEIMLSNVAKTYTLDTLETSTFQPRDLKMWGCR